jgi:hypothetical protein
LGIRGHIHKARLEGGPDGDAAADQEHACGEHVRVLSRQGEHRHHDHAADQRAGDRGDQGLVGKPRADEIADDHARPEQSHHDRNSALGHVGHLRCGRGDVGENREQAAEAHGPDAEGEPDLLALEGAEFAQRACSLLHTILRQEQPDQRNRERAHHAYGRKGDPPAHGLAEPGGDRGADEGRDGEAQHHPRNGLGALVGRDQRGCDQRRHAEIGPVRQPGQEPHQHKGFKARRKGADDVSSSENRHQDQQEGLPRELCRKDRDDGSADHHAESICADRISGLGRRHAEFLRQVRQQAHDGELACADPETSNRQRDLDQGHREARAWNGGLLGPRRNIDLCHRHVRHGVPNFTGAWQYGVGGSRPRVILHRKNP